MNKKAIVLLSGGLDSILAARMMLEQGVEVVAVNYFVRFAMCGGPDESSAIKAAKALGLKLNVFDITDEYLEMFKKPKHGYGANINPCIDCKIFMLKKAKEYMKEAEASFLVTGEVLGERPMSQRRDALNIIERDAGVKGILLRPLSAKLLNPTIPEKEGVVDRNGLMDISGRSRKPQMALAEKFGIKEYPNPAGGCLLTDPGFSRRVKDLIGHDLLNVEELELLSTGRHFRISDKAKIIIGRDEDENRRLESHIKKGDIIFRMKNKPGPFSILKGIKDESVISLAASIVAYHTKFRNEEKSEVNYWEAGSREQKTIIVKPASSETVENVRL